MSYGVEKLKLKYSKHGCITCKIRKKRCSEDKPVCRDCFRLNFPCIYISESVDKQSLKKIKADIQRQLVSKKRKHTGDSVEQVAVATYAHQSYDSELDNQIYLSKPLEDCISQKLDSMGLQLYNYYRSHLANIISIAPMNQNYYLNIFLPMAHENDGILFAILAWSANHLSISSSDELRKDEIFVSLANKYTYMSLTDLKTNEASGPYAKLSFLYSLAQILILCGSEICQGDVKFWKILMNIGKNLIENHVGKDISRILTTTTEEPSLEEKIIFPNFNSVVKYWLIVNFIYHDILNFNTTSFPIEQYEKFFQRDHNSLPNSVSFIEPVGSPIEEIDPLIGINKPILLLLGQVTNLTRFLQSMEQEEMLEHGDKILSLQVEIYRLQPSLMALDILDNDKKFYYLELFEIMKISTLMFFQLTLLKIDKDALELQILINKLNSKLDRVIGTFLEGSLCFPLFIYGVCIRIHDMEKKIDLEAKFDDILKRYKCYNFQNARLLVRKIWQNEADGIREHDLVHMIDELDYNINFA
ncbi:uga3p [Saccharomyces arboricola H-6]|uniref:Uga3p n=1 Tax=Saccharomyces arboricola (strain H-6 / AS 2.3317 / CBS 10644) TaxID=1160507 RepID=J8LQK1_SACAR|nr:uga3p [Saccharomyces arboricola H-6]